MLKIELEKHLSAPEYVLAFLGQTGFTVKHKTLARRRKVHLCVAFQMSLLNIYFASLLLGASELKLIIFFYYPILCDSRKHDKSVQNKHKFLSKNNAKQ